MLFLVFGLFLSSDITLMTIEVSYVQNKPKNVITAVKVFFTTLVVAKVILSIYESISNLSQGVKIIEAEQFIDILLHHENLIGYINVTLIWIVTVALVMGEIFFERALKTMFGDRIDLI